MHLSPPISIAALLPELVVLITGCVVLLLGQGSAAVRRLTGWTALAGLIIATLLVIAPDWGAGVSVARDSGNGVILGSLTLFVRKAALTIGIILVLVNWTSARADERGEFLAMMLFSLTGLLLVAPANDLLLLFLALELTSIPTYIMIVLSRSNVRSVEAGTKYFYLGAMSAAVMAYGFAFLYGVSGTTSLTGTLEAVAAALDEPGTLVHGLTMIGLILSIGGLLFKIAAVPLHFYIADVYQGAASPVAGLLGFVPKIAGIVAIFKIVAMTGLWNFGNQEIIFWLLWLIAAFSMTVGNVMALRQTNIKRLLGYSGIAHAGYMLVGLLAGPLAGQGVNRFGGIGIMGDGTAAVLFYVVIYGIANLGAFAVLGALTKVDRPCETLRDVAGLIRRDAGAAMLLVLAMFTLMGLPPTPGFWGKLSLFGSALSASQADSLIRDYQPWMITLVIIAVLNSALAAAYYLRVIAAVLIYPSDPAGAWPASEREAPRMGALLCGFLLIVFAILPQLLMPAGRSATAEFLDRVRSTSYVLYDTQQHTPDSVAQAPPVAPGDPPAQ